MPLITEGYKDRPGENHLKFGTTKNFDTRYTKEELAGGRLKRIGSGTADDMNALERKLHKTLPLGPEEAQRAYGPIQKRKGLKPPEFKGGKFQPYKRTGNWKKKPF